MNKRRAILFSRKGMELISILIRPSLAVFLEMEQFVLIPQQLYEQKSKLKVYKLAKSDEKVNFAPQKVDPLHKEIRNKTKSYKNESVVDQILKCSRIKLSLSDSILLDGRDTNVAFTDFFTH